ncbi:hypothetical protein TNCT_388331 [Trichonephila clavata]|uniref:Mos1 transposase HTH domain-containing protein n=1 Tax=Trichonephila clavata TaxID=2740835 RepID=A0A8X6F5P8_TRICU|nr:hypothetical protein TNCT_388331 [Trichonephila clavata]
MQEIILAGSRSVSRGISSSKKSTSFLKQRYVINFCIKLSKTGVETFEILRKVYNDETMKLCQTFMWRKRFREVLESVDDGHSGHLSIPQTDNSVQKVRQVLGKDRLLNVSMFAEECEYPPQKNPFIAF